MYEYPDYLMHHGVKGMRWGVRRAQKKSAKRIKRLANKAYSNNKKVSDVYSAVRNTSEYKKHNDNVKTSRNEWSKAFVKSEKDSDRRLAKARKQADNDKSNPYEKETRFYRKYQEGLVDYYLEKYQLVSRRFLKEKLGIITLKLDRNPLTTFLENMLKRKLNLVLPLVNFYLMHKPPWRNGIRSGLKIRRPYRLMGSNPIGGTIRG